MLLELQAGFLNQDRLQPAIVNLIDRLTAGQVRVTDFKSLGMRRTWFVSPAPFDLQSFTILYILYHLRERILIAPKWGERGPRAMAPAPEARTDCGIIASSKSAHSRVAQTQGVGSIRIPVTIGIPKWTKNCAKRRSSTIARR